MKNKIRYSKECAGIVLVLLTLLSSVTFAQRTPTIEHVQDSANTTQFKITVPKDYLEYGPWVTIGKESYQNYAQTMWHVTDSTYETLMTFIYAVDSTVVIPIELTYEDIKDQSGVIVQDSVIGFIQPGDWIYFGTLDMTGRKKINFMYSYGNAEAGRTMSFRINSPTGPIIAQWTHKTTGNWNTYTYDEIEIDNDVIIGGPAQIFVTFEGDTSGQYNYVVNLRRIRM